jgi:hypothetical protein
MSPSYRYLLGTTVAIGCLVMIFQNCSSSLPSEVTDSSNSGQQAPVTPDPGPATVTPVTPVLPALSASYSPNPAIIGSAISILPTGGDGIYTYIVTGATGAWNATTKIYTAPMIAETPVVTIRDSSGNVFALTIPVVDNRVKIPLYRYRNTTVDPLGNHSNEHLFVASKVSYSNYVYEGSPFSVFRDKTDARMVPLYFCNDTVGIHYLSRDSSCEERGRPAGDSQRYYNSPKNFYVYNVQVTGTVPLYRRFIKPAPWPYTNGNSPLWDLFATITAGEGGAYQDGGILGYVIRNP